MPDLQSLVIVLLKAVLANVTALITNPVGAQPLGGLAPGFRSESNLRANGAATQSRPDPVNVPLPNPVEPIDMPIEDVEALRSREITAKAVSAILLVILKWFKVSRNSLICGWMIKANECRCSEIRVLHSAIAGFELSSAGFETLRSSGDR